MARVFTEKPADGPIAQRLLDATDKTLEKATILSEVQNPGQYVMGGITITINSIELDAGNKRLKVMCSAEEAGNPINLDLPFYFINPYFSIPDGTYRRETIDGKEYELINNVENPVEALKLMVYETVIFNKNN